MVFQDESGRQGGTEMDKEFLELLEEKLFVFSKRDDLERLRQETNANFRKLKEENRDLILGGIEGIRAEMEELKRERGVDLDPLCQEMKKEIKSLESKIQSVLLQSIPPLESSLEKMVGETRPTLQQLRQEIEADLQTVKDEIHTALLQSRQEITSDLQLTREEGKSNLLQARSEERENLFRMKEEMKMDFNRLGEGMENLSAQLRTAVGEIIVLKEKVREGFIEVREELGAMIKFSYADLEKRFAKLEARIKALEKLVLPEGNL